MESRSAPAACRHPLAIAAAIGRVLLIFFSSVVWLHMRRETWNLLVADPGGGDPELPHFPNLDSLGLINHFPPPQ